MRGHPAIFRRLVILGPAFLLVAGCEALGDPNDQPGDDPCRTGPGATAGVKVRVPGVEWSCFLCEDWGLRGIARLDSLSGEEGRYTLTLSFSEDATWVSVDLSIPADAPLPVAVGEEIEADVSASCCWYSSYSAVSLRTLTGLLLLSAFSGGATLNEVPPPCKENGPLECGYLGYPDLVVQHPYGVWDPSAPWVKLRQGEEVVLVHRGVAYRSIISGARTWIENQCTETPQTLLSRATVLVPTPVPAPVPAPAPVPVPVAVSFPAPVPVPVPGPVLVPGPGFSRH